VSGRNRLKLGELVRLHHRSLVRFVSGIVGSAETAEDITHDVYVKETVRAAAPERRQGLSSFSREPDFPT